MIHDTYAIPAFLDARSLLPERLKPVWEENNQHEINQERVKFKIQELVAVCI